MKMQIAGGNINNISIWLSVDPMTSKYPSLSPYVYCANNPIRLVDPDGMEFDDYFNKLGKFLYRDNKKTDFIKIVEKNPNSKNNGINNLSLNDFTITPIENTKLSDNAINNIIHHYDNELGSVEGKDASVKLDIKHRKPNSSIIMEASFDPGVFFGSTGEIRTTVIDQKIHKYLNTGSNIKNSLVHEYKHQADYKLGYGAWNHEAFMERRAINAQRAHPSYKTTTKDYKNNLIRYENKFK